jgi:hypothetical protein
MSFRGARAARLPRRSAGGRAAAAARPPLVFFVTAAVAAAAFAIAPPPPPTCFAQMEFLLRNHTVVPYGQLVATSQFRACAALSPSRAVQETRDETRLRVAAVHRGGPVPHAQHV